MYFERRHPLLLLALSVVGCKSPDDDLFVGSDQSQDASPESRSDAGPSDAGGCSEGSPRACACGDAAAAGVETCSDGVFGICRGCPSSAGRSLCVPGYYHTASKGTYTSSAGILPGVIALPVVDNSFEWNFSLNPEGSAEFTTLGNGCMHVIEQGADPIATEGKSRSLLTGDVNCNTGAFTGVVRGYYTGPDALLVAERKYYYKGTITATYDPEQMAFVDGVYTLVEPPTVFGDALGGKGVFTARASDATPVEDTGECLIGGFPGEMFK